MGFLSGVLLIASINAYSIEWRDLEVLQKYNLKQSFQLPQIERSGSLLDFSEGEQVVLSEKLPLTRLGIMLYMFNYIPCPGNMMKTDMEIIPVQETAPVIEVGVQLETGCELNVYVEIKDLFTRSILK
jgi:hypothetical protein